jgi:hypothetical protein
MVAVHNTPFGDIVDTEDDLLPVVFAAFWDATRAISLFAAPSAAPSSTARNWKRVPPKAGSP